MLLQNVDTSRPNCAILISPSPQNKLNWIETEKNIFRDQHWIIRPYVIYLIYFRFRLWTLCNFNKLNWIEIEKNIFPDQHWIIRPYVIYLIYFRFRLWTVCNFNYTPTTWGVQSWRKNNISGLRQQKRLNTTVLDVLRIINVLFNSKNLEITVLVRIYFLLFWRSFQICGALIYCVRK
jgi:hypothetical protein